MRKEQVIRVPGLLAVLVLLGLETAAALPIAKMEIGPKTVRDDVFPRPPVPFANGVIALPDIEPEFRSKPCSFRMSITDLSVRRQTLPVMPT